MLARNFWAPLASQSALPTQTLASRSKHSYTKSKQHLNQPKAKKAPATEPGPKHQLTQQLLSGLKVLNTVQSPFHKPDIEPKDILPSLEAFAGEPKRPFESFSIPDMQILNLLHSIC
jgi:hypothetical protein